MVLFAFLYLFAAFIYLYMGIFTISNDSKHTANKIYFVICFIMFCWSSISILILLSPDAQLATQFRQYAIFTWGILYSVLLHFFIVLTNRSHYLKNPLALIMIYVPAAFAIYLYFFRQPETVLSIIKTPLGWVYASMANQGLIWDYYLTVYYLSCLLISVFLLWTWGKKSLIKREKRQARIMMATILAAIVLGSITDIILPKINLVLLPPTAVILCLIPIGGIWYAMKKYRLMNLSYEMLTLDILKVIDDGLIIVDYKGSIVDANAGALLMLGYKDKQKVIGQSFKTIFPDDMDITAIGASKNKETYVRTSENKTIAVLLQYLTLTDQLGDNLGSLVSFQDISEIKEVQKYLEEAKDSLEDKVMERTIELEKSNFELKNEMKARTIVEDKIKKLAFHDTLTNLPNRRLFDDRLEQAILKAERDQKYLGLLYLDIDFFKNVNDALGHVKGDKLLIEIATRLKNRLRKSDTIARVGGDEFLILLQEIEDYAYIQKISEDILNCFKFPFVIEGQELNITTSIGISIYPIDGPDFETLVKNADAAMYKSKEGGKNRIEFCTMDLKEKRNQNIRLTNSLYHALERNELELYYQPQVDARTNKIIGAEALLRWHHPDLGFVSPAVFIPIAETSGLIISIGEWVLYEACRQNKHWQDMGFEPIPIAVNVSVKQFSYDVIVGHVKEILEETGLSPNCLELEITESLLMENVDTVTRTLRDLKEIGVKLTIDDFGTEYTSLNYLKYLPIDRIKIATTFIHGLNINQKDEIITKAIILLAQNLNMEVIAEGVENKEQLDFLKESACDIIQGYYFYKPMSKDEFEKAVQFALLVIV